MRSRALAPAHGVHALGSSSRWSSRPESGSEAGSGAGAGAKTESGADAASLAGAATAPRGVPTTSASALVFLRGRDADNRLVELGAARRAARPVLGALAIALRTRGAHHGLGFSSLGDYSRERLGVGARTVREWARVWAALETLPRLRQAVLSGEVSWTIARLVVGFVTPESEEACLETVRGRTVRAVQAIVAAVRNADPNGDGAGSEGESDRVRVQIPCERESSALWATAVELARRVAGEALPVWECADRIAAEAATVLGVPTVDVGTPSDEGAATPTSHENETGLRAAAFPCVRWRTLCGALPQEVAALVDGLEDASACEIDRRLRAAIAFLQSVDFETGRVLRQVLHRRLFIELGFGRFDRYCSERLDFAVRTARRLMAIARAEHRAPAVATAFRVGKIHGFQAQAVLRVADLESAERWVSRARRVSLRRLEEDVEARAPQTGAIAFRAPAPVAERFLAMVARAGSIERLLAHAIVTWVQAGERFEDYADFERDGFRCTVPGCTARRNLQSHHIRFRSRGGPDVAWNRTTLCAHHHLRSVHLERVVAIRGRAPDQLEFQLGGERFRSGDVRM